MSAPFTITKSHRLSSVVFDAASWTDFDTVVSLGAAQAGTASQMYLPLPSGGKIFLACVSFSAIGTPQANHLFNIVVGNVGAYESSASTGASQTATFTGPFNVGDVFSFSLAGVPITLIAPAAPNQGKMANLLAANIVDNYTPVPDNPVNRALGIVGIPLHRVFGANANAGVVTLGALVGGAAYNTIPITASVVTGAGGTFVAGGATLTGGVNAAGITTPINDSYPSQGTFTPAPAGSALFAQDQVLIGNPVGSSAIRYGYFYQPTAWDAYFVPGTVLTLRVQTPAATGSLANLKVSLLTKAFDAAFNKPQRLAVPNAGFLPLRDVG